MGEYDPTHPKAKRAWLDRRFEEMTGPDGKFHDDANHQGYILSVLTQRALHRYLGTLTSEQRKQVTRADIEAALGRTSSR